MPEKEISLNWIDVNDDLPKEDGCFLVLGDYGYAVMPFFEENETFTDCFGDEDDSITHWCELTPPIKSVQEARKDAKKEYEV